MEEFLKEIPSVTEILKNEEIKRLIEKYPKWLIVEKVRDVIADRRSYILNNKGKCNKTYGKGSYIKDVLIKVEEFIKPSLRWVVNCTGVIIHTNLGRAPLPVTVFERLSEVASAFSNIEYDLSKGERGLRGDHYEAILRALTLAEDSLVVNNNAGALLLVLSTFAKRKEVVISRGEIVEIGGGFRINEILRASGAILTEVGTTNKTRVDDYKEAISEKTGAILKVHTSNFKIIGFHQVTHLEEIVKLGSSQNLITIFDAGSGLLIDMGRYGLKGEPVIKDVVKTGVDLVTFSGDKLLGGPQCGIIIGKKDLITKLKKNPMFRALRVCKLTLSSLETCLTHYLRGDHLSQIPVLRMIARGVYEIERDAFVLLKKLRSIDGENLFNIEMKKGESYIGGGSYPGTTLETRLISIKGNIGSSRLERSFREFDPPVIARIEDDELLLDLRTILKQEIMIIEGAFKSLCCKLMGAKTL